LWSQNLSFSQPFKDLSDNVMQSPTLPADLGRLAILLDVDGTLLNFASTPRQVFVSLQLRDTLARLRMQTNGAVAFVSGRPVSELDLLFAPLQLPAVGGHGAEIRIRSDVAPETSRSPPLDPNIKRKFASIAELGRGIILEDKGYSLAVHYRLAPDKENLVREMAAEICAAFPAGSVELLPGKLVLEIKQAGFNKMTGVRKLMACPPFAGRRPIFIGDDITDLGVFAIMPEFKGIGISVGKRIPGTFSFERPSDVRYWLERISHNDSIVTS
jgi:trehalose 6-phosphate phosphatase